MKYIKIAFIGPLPPPFGGVAIMNQSFQNLNYDGFEVIAFDTSAKNKREDLSVNFKFNSLQRNLKISKNLNKFIVLNKPDLVNIFITSGTSILRDILFLKKLNKFQIPVIIHFHSKTFGEFALTPRRLRILGKYFNRYANRIILLSDQHFNFFINYFGKEKCIVIENFVNYKDYENESINKNEEFLFVGRLTLKKGFYDLLEAAKILKSKNITCIINVIGLASSVEQESLIKSIISEYALEKYFAFHGATFGEAKYKLFKKSRCLIFPSHFENSPVVLKEAIAAKMAIISSDIEANANILQHRENYISFKTGNPDDLAQKMIRLINEPEKTEQMCEVSAGIKDYDVFFAKQKIQSLFNELIT
tara:strand:- start:4126 stop:5211 length:1086 start_codon:yes stop_codon:yes gene_type:complete